MSILGVNRNSSHSNMMSQSSAPLFNEFKKQAAFYIKEKIKTARLALTDVTIAQLMTEEATSDNPRAPDTRTMGFISRAAFEVDDYWRIVDILHTRLAKFDRKYWRPSYNALFVLEHLITHGPESTAKEFQDEMRSIWEMQFLQHIDEKGFNWGLAVSKKAERLLELLDKGPLLKEERNRVRKVTRGIQGFGSFSERISSSAHGILQESKSTYHGEFGRSHSQFNEHGNQDKEGDNNYSNNILPSGEDGYSKTNSTRTTAEKIIVNPTASLKLRSPNSKENSEPISSDRARGEVLGWNSMAMGDHNPLLSSESVDAGLPLMDVGVHPFSATEKESRISLLGRSSDDL